MYLADSIEGYAAIRAHEHRGIATAESYVAWAQEMLARGFDSPSLLRLAIEEPPYFTPDLARLFAASIGELDIEPLDGEAATILRAQEIAVDLISGFVTPKEAAATIVRLNPAGGPWTLLDAADWCDDCAQSFTGPDRTLNQAILEEAEKLLEMDWRAPRP